VTRLGLVDAMTDSWRNVRSSEREVGVTCRVQEMIVSELENIPGTYHQQSKRQQ
jgi:hypothetical protein